jgi:hypothetical protein
MYRVAMTWLCPGSIVFSSPLVSNSNDVASVCKARFVTAGAISMKLGVGIPLIFKVTFQGHRDQSSKLHRWVARFVAV